MAPPSQIESAAKMIKGFTVWAKQWHSDSQRIASKCTKPSYSGNTRKIDDACPSPSCIILAHPLLCRKFHTEFKKMFFAISIGIAAMGGFGFIVKLVAKPFLPSME